MMNFKAFHMSERGESHLHDGRVCQDSSASFSDECGTVAVVSDGHGGRDYVRSQIGSAMPVKRQLNIFVSYLKISARKRFWRNRI